MQEEGWVMPSKNLREISSLQLGRVSRFATNNIDIYGMPCVEFKIIWMARFWSPSSWPTCTFVMCE